MQAHVLELYERARAAGRFASWHREREIVAGWMGHLRAQGNSALGAMGAFISFHWEDECQRQAATFISQPGASWSTGGPTQPWQQPSLSYAEGATSRSAMGPIGFVLDLHAAWHRRMMDCIVAVVNMGSSIKIVPGGLLPPIFLGPDNPLQPAVGQPRSTLQPNNRADSAYNGQHSRQAGPMHPRRGAPPQMTGAIMDRNSLQQRLAGSHRGATAAEGMVIVPLIANSRGTRTGTGSGPICPLVDPPLV
jgi:hypothetical protein